MSEIAYPVRAVCDSVSDADGLRICDASWLDNGDGAVYATARRIAACLNACRDIPTEALEQVAAMGEYDRNFGLQMLGSAAATVAFNNSGSAAREG